jgi:hypothetical protein
LLTSIVMYGRNALLTALVRRPRRRDAVGFGQPLSGARALEAAGVERTAEGGKEDVPGCALRLLRGCEWRAGRVTPPAVQECGGALAGPGERSVRVAECLADECLDRVPDIGEHLLGCGVRS